MATASPTPSPRSAASLSFLKGTTSRAPTFAGFSLAEVSTSALSASVDQKTFFSRGALSLVGRLERFDPVAPSAQHLLDTFAYLASGRRPVDARHQQPVVGGVDVPG